MQTNQNLERDKVPFQVSQIETDHGFFNSTTILAEMENVFNFCKKQENIHLVLKDLPDEIHNYLDLELVSADKNGPNEYQIKWKNSPNSKVSGTFLFIFQKAPASRGTYFTAEANFDIYRFKKEEPSLLMRIFLRRMKTLMETGEIPTTRRPPSGREEFETTKNKTLH